MTYDRDTVLQYLNLIGIDESEFNSRIRKNKKFRLENLSDMYEVSNASNYLLTSSSKDVGTYYELLLAQLDNDLLYDDAYYKESAKEDAFYLLNKVSNIQVSEDDDPFTIFERTNSLLSSILAGLTCSENLGKLRLVYDNADPRVLLNIAIMDREMVKPLYRLHLLMALSKINNSDVDYQIFNDNEEIDDKKLLHVVGGLLFDGNKPVNDEKEKEVYKSLSFKRPSFKQLESCK